jgi:hypothetical protein
LYSSDPPTGIADIDAGFGDFPMHHRAGPNNNIGGDRNTMCQDAVAPYESAGSDTAFSINHHPGGYVAMIGNLRIVLDD